MIIELSPIKISQSRDVKPVYQEPWDPNYDPMNWGKPVDMNCSPEVKLEVSINLTYTKEHNPLIRKLLDVVREISEAAREGQDEQASSTRTD